jgi:hypothetical protein
MKKVVLPFLGNLIAVLFVLFTNAVIAQSASDQASNYAGSWTNGSNQGTGFGAWTLTNGANSGWFIGDPASNGMTNTNIGSAAFGLYSTGTGYVNAARTLTTALVVGDAVSFYWAANWDANTGSKGIDFKSGATVVLNVNMAGSSTLTAGGVSAQTVYGTNPVLITMARISASQYTFTMTSRDGVSSLYTAAVNSALAIDNLNFYCGNQNDANGNRNVYFNKLMVAKIQHRSAATGTWSTLSSWIQSADNGTTWYPATVAPSSIFGTTNILNGHNITAVAVTTDQLTIEAGGTLTVPTATTVTIANGADAIDCSILGTLTNAGTITPTGNITAGATGVYQHNQNGGTIPAITWATGSECKVIGVTAALPGGVGQSFYHFTWDCTSQSAAVNFAAGLVTVNGNLKIWNTGNNELRLCANTSASLTVNGSVIIGGNTVGGNSIFNLCSGTAPSMVVYIRGGLTITAGALSCSNTTATRQIYFDSSTGNVQDINLTTPTMAISGAIDFYVGNSGGSKVRLLTDMSVTGEFDILNGGTLDFQTFALKGTQAAGKAFVANSGSNLITANTNSTGAFLTSTAFGSVQLTGTRTYTGSKITFNGTAAQKTGNGVTNVQNITINNATGVTLTNNVTVSSTLTLTAGNLNLGTFYMLISNSAANAIVGGSASSYVITGDPQAFIYSSSLNRRIANTGLPISYVFPVGNTTSYMPVTYTFTANSTVRDLYVFTSNSTESSLTGFTSYLNGMCWFTNLSSSLGTYTYNATFEFPVSAVAGSYASLKLYRPATTFTDAGSTTSGVNTSITSSALTETTGNLSGPISWTAVGTAGSSSQTITFNSLSAVTYGVAPYSLTATASSGLPVSYTSSNTAVATVSGSTITIVGAGSTIITASQSGNATYTAATPVTQTLVVNPLNLTVTGAAAQNKTYDGTNAATITGASLVGVVGSDVVSLAGGGTFGAVNVANGIAVTATFSLTGSNAGNYTLTQPTGLSANITQASQTITFGTLTAVNFGSANFTLTATASSGLGITYTSSNPAVATVSGSTVTVVGVGTTTITASQSGNTNYAAATSVNQTLTVNQASQTITFGALANKTITDVPYTISATATSGLAVTFTSSNTSVATVSGNTITIVGPGTTNITAAQAGNTNYAAAPNVVQPLTVSVPSLIWFDTSTLPGGTNSFGPSPYTASAAANVTSTGLQRGSGVSTTATAAARAWGGVNWSNSLTPDLTTTSFISFNANVAIGYKMNLMEIAPFGYRRSGSGPTNAVLQYSTDGTNFTTITTLNFTSSANSGASLSSIDLSAISALQNLTHCTTVTFKLVPYGATSNAGTFYIFDVLNNTASDLALNGLVSALPSSPVVSISSSDSDGVMCQGESVTFTATASASTTIAYQWKNDGVNISGQTSSTYTTTSLSTGTITCVIDACGQTATSNGVYSTVMTVPTLNMSASSGATVCSSTTPTFTTTGASTYQYFLNGVAQGAPSSTNTFTPSAGLNGGDQICVRGFNALPFTIDGNLTDPYWGAALATSNGGPASSGFGANRLDALYMKNGLGYLFGGIAGSLQNSSGNKVLLFIDCNSGGYQQLSSWIYRSNSPYYSIQNLNGGIQFDSGFSPDYIMGINIASDVLYFDLYNMQTNSNTFLGASNGGAMYAYQSNTGTGDYTKGLEFSIPMYLLGNISGGIKVMAMLVNDPGAASATYLSNQFLSPAGAGEGNYASGAVQFNLANPNPVSYTVLQDCYTEQCLTTTQSVNPSVAIVSDDADNSVCAGIQVVLTATPNNGGTGPGYQWKLNGSNVGNNSSQYTFTPVNGDVVSVEMTPNNICQLQNSVTSNSITTTVIANANPTISIVSDLSGNVICGASGTTVTFTATAGQAGTTPVYQWKKNGTNVGTNAATFSTSTLAGGDLITCVLTPNNVCQSSNSVASAPITLVAASTQTYYADGDADGYGNATVSTTSCTIPSGYVSNSQDCDDTNANIYTGATEVCNGVDDNCDGNVDEGLQVTPAISISSDDADNSICAGTAVVFTATATNGGTAPAFQWKKNGTNVGTGGSTYSASDLLNGDQISVVLTANNACQTAATSNSNVLTFTVTSVVTPSASISSDAASNTICTSSNTLVTFTATGLNTGTTPTWVWKKNGATVGTNSISYSTNSLNVGDVISVVMQTNQVCQSVSSSTSNSITMLAASTASYYLDADNDGYGLSSSLVSDCIHPIGYVTQSGDCNDNDASISPIQIEICNGVDDNCNGQSEEGLTFINFYLDNDGDGYGSTTNFISACDVVAGYITQGGDCNDNSVNANPGLSELCSTNYDDNCNGLINEVCTPGNDNAAYASNCVLSTSLTGCNLYTGTLLAASASSAMSTGWISGPDVWYYFTANAVGVTIKGTSVANDLALELRTYNGTLLKSANGAVGIGDEYLNYGSLNVGQQYYVRIRNANPTQVGGAFTLCAKRLSNSSNLNYTNSILYDNGCDMVSATNTTGSNTCTIELTPISPAGGPALVASGFSVPMANFTGALGEKVQYNTTYSANITLTFTVPVAGGGSEEISISKISDYPLVVSSHLDLDLGTVNSCPNKVVLGGLVRATTWMCDAVKYQWKFERMLNGSLYLANGNPVVIEAYGANGTRDFVLSTSLGFTAGTEWRVQIRPIFANGVVGLYGTDYQCMLFKGTAAAMPLADQGETKENETTLKTMETAFQLYPNPSHEGHFTISWNEAMEDGVEIQVFDQNGKQIHQQYAFDEMRAMIDGEAWASGLYQVRIRTHQGDFTYRWMKI